MWKHKTKWLLRGGRKVKCYLCGKKILAKGDLFLFHGDTGYYSHQSCQAESTTISGNERRRAVKKIAVGAAVVGAIAAGAGRCLDVSSQSKNCPAAQTILTSQGLILPALTSDPANPVAGQMWYRSDKGVTAHFDAIENRVIYSNRILDGSEVVSAKGIVNGLSVLPNDGQDWGPDTTKGATAPGQYGSPYTETTGIQDAVNYVGTGINLPVVLSAGVFTISTSIVINYNGIRILGSGHANSPSNNGVGTVLYTTTTGIDLIDLDEEDGNTLDWEIGNIRFVFEGSLSSTGSGINVINPSTTQQFVHAYFHDLSVHNATTYAYQFTGFLNSRFEGLYSDNCNGTLSIKSTGTGQDVAGNSTFITIKDAAPRSGATNPDLNIDGSASSNNGGGVQQIVFIRLEIEIVDTVEAININNANNLTFINTDLDQYTSTVPTSFMILDNVYQSSFINLMIGLDSNTTTGLSITDSENIIFDNPIVLGSGSVIDFTLSNLESHTVIFRGNFDQSLRANGGKIDASSYTAIKFVDFDDYNLTPSISTNPPVSGTAYQNTNPYDIEIDLPVYATTSGTAGYVTVAKGSTDTPTAIGNQFVNGSTSSTSVDIIRLRVPAGWYYEFTASGVTFGTASVFAD